jgi:DNA modification methylase
MGSGTTGRVCDKFGRSFVGYDLKGNLQKTMV